LDPPRPVNWSQKGSLGQQSIPLIDVVGVYGSLFSVVTWVVTVTVATALRSASRPSASTRWKNSNATPRARSTSYIGPTTASANPAVGFHKTAPR
jgi:hypothetical protein